MNSNDKVNFLTKYNNQFSMIPLKGVGKVAAIEGWQKYSDEMSTFTIEELAENNYGIVTGRASNLLVLDVDDIKVFNSFLRRNGFSVPDTFEVKTGKGKHLYFTYPGDEKEYPCKRYGVYEFDIRGKGGYTVGPYSLHEESGRHYEVSVDVDMAEAPIWLMAYSLQINEGNGKPSIDNKVRNKEILELIKLGTEKGQRSEAMFKVLMSLVANKFTDDQIYYVFNKYPIGEKYQEKPVGLRDEWLQGQIDRAREFVSESKVAVETDNDVKMPEITYLNTSELLKKDIKIKWLIPNLLEEGGHLLIVGKSGIGKSMFTLNMTYALASAPEGGFMGYSIPEALKVVVIQCENSEAFMQQRVQSLFKANPELSKGKENVDFVQFNGRHDNPSFKLSNENLEIMIKKIHEDKKPDVIIIDPYKSYSGVHENDNDENREVLDKLFRILGEHGITAIIVHHEGKASEYSGASRSRGASTITDTVSNHWSLSRADDIKGHEERMLIECAKSRNSKKFKDIYLEIANGIYFKLIDTPLDPVKLTDLLFEIGGEVDTQSKLITLIQHTFGASEAKARQMIFDAEKKGFIVSEKYGQNKMKYYLPLQSKAA